ncbi:TetR/AcrR family transcriptional regulator [Reinekea sp. G2M2-21]|uniref:TetR/AcrR family transcriptional regulator n=1 Tax=Reinekea sp. G2M2-21 TaxID=2788942 RepID=UPI0018ABD87F|nr:TetR/AcrR family transcriptional regulator [Reinekea sp. G2M2-21]
MKTVDRILEASLILLNEQGAAKVTTNAIADQAELSVGNLYYHFKNKDEIILALFKRFNAQLTPLLSIVEEDCELEHWALWWHEWFDSVGHYQFLFHDQSYLQYSNRHIRPYYHRLMKQVEQKQLSIFQSLKHRNELVATESDLIRIAQQVTFIAIFWQDFYEMHRHTSTQDQSPFTSALQQILGLLLPYMKAAEQIRVEQLIKQPSMVS